MAEFVTDTESVTAALTGRYVRPKSKTQLAADELNRTWYELSGIRLGITDRQIRDWKRLYPERWEIIQSCAFRSDWREHLKYAETRQQRPQRSQDDEETPW